MAGYSNSEQIPLAKDAAGSSSDVAGHIDAASHHALSAMKMLDDSAHGGGSLVGMALREAVRHLKIAQEQQQLTLERVSLPIWNVPGIARSCSSVGRETGNPTAWGPDCSTLSGTGAWGPYNNRLEWLQLDLDEPGLVGGVITKGKVYTWKGGPTYDGWVSKFSVKYLVDPVVAGSAMASATWGCVDAGAVFHGNQDATNEVVTFFSEPVFAKSVRIVTHDWSRPGGTVLKVDILRHEVIALTLAAKLVDATSVKIVVTDMGGETICTLEREGLAPSDCLWLELSKKLGKPRRWLKLMLPDGTLLFENESKDAAIAQVLKV